MAVKSAERVFRIFELLEQSPEGLTNKDVSSLLGFAPSLSLIHILSAPVLLEQGKELTREEIKKKMSGNLCRCTGYQNIVNAVEKVMHENTEKDGIE